MQFRPAREAHSIEDFSLAVRFWRPVGEAVFTSSQAKLREAAAKADMPAARPFSTVQIPAQPGVPEFEVSFIAPPPTGVAFQRFTKYGTIEEQLRLEPAMISYRTSAYKRWKDVEELVGQTILPVAKDFLAEGPTLSALVLQYVDLFYSEKPGDQDCSELFEPNSPWVISALMNKQSWWHSHSGLFDDVNEDSKRLINVNVDVSDRKPLDTEKMSRAVSILTLCSQQYQDTNNLAEPEAFATEVVSRLKVLHDRSKQVLAEVLSDPYRRRISLKTGQEA